MTTPSHTPGRARLAPNALAVPPHSARERAALAPLRALLGDRLRDDPTHRVLYAADASLYELLPVAVAFPRDEQEVQRLLEICSAHEVPMTARAAGTSLSGQTVGPGLIVDMGRHMRSVLHVDREARWARVQPGVIRDDLNRQLKSTGLMFAPDTSTSNRCMIGGMIGNNSCGSHSLRYGTTRDHVLGMRCFTADGVVAQVGAEGGTWEQIAAGGGTWGRALEQVGRLVQTHADTILHRWPKEAVRRRNTGYALDLLARSSLTGRGDRPPQLTDLLCGSEGTLAWMSEATLRLTEIPRHRAMVVAHFGTLAEAFEATVEAVRWSPLAVELLDRRILELARLNPEQERHRWFIEGDPGALLLIEVDALSPSELEEKVTDLRASLQAQGRGYAHTILQPPQEADAWALRKAGLGVLMGAPGDIKPVTIVEDTAVAVEDLPAYMDAFAEIMARHAVDCVYYAHASVGEIHLRPELDLKQEVDKVKAETIAAEVAELVARFQGALSGEHGDGRVRSPFLERVLGAEGVGLLEEVKRAFDPAGLLNPHVIVGSRPFREAWRYHDAYVHRDMATSLAFEDAGGLQRMVERCNGAGVCRRSAASGGTMCPSYMATLEERESTRGRANLLRRALQAGPEAIYESEELQQALDLCLSCKGCKSDCPASVDMARLKAEVTQGRMDRKGVPLGARLVAELPRHASLLRRLPGGVRFANRLLGVAPVRRALERVVGFGGRALPPFAPRSARSLLGDRPVVAGRHGRVGLYLDELTDLYEPERFVEAALLLEAGGWEVVPLDPGPSGRTYLSKGFVRAAAEKIERCWAAFERALEGGEVEAVVGLEPSALLTFRDEGLDLGDSGTRARRRALAPRVVLLEEFLVEVQDRGAWSGMWQGGEVPVRVHGHCHQKAIVGMEPLLAALRWAQPQQVEALSTGCCGMAGSFGYEHPELSHAIASLALLPALDAAAPDTVFIGAGISCRHQAEAWGSRPLVHPVTWLAERAGCLPRGGQVARTPGH